MAVIPDNYTDLLGTKKSFAHIATIMKDGRTATCRFAARS